MNSERQTIHSFISRDNHLALGSKRESNHIHGGDYQLRMTRVSRDSDDASPATQRRGYVQISFTIKCQTLWSTQTPEEYARIS